MTDELRTRVVTILGLLLVLDLVAIALLSTGLGQGRPIPDVLELLASSALAGLLGILANGVPHTGRRRRAGRNTPPPS